MKRIINITDITEYLYCPRKVFLKLVKGIRAPPNQRMINGMLRHKVFDLFNKSESALVSSIKSKINEAEIRKLYLELVTGITQEVLMLNDSLARKFGIEKAEFSNSVNKTLEPEINLRVPIIKEAMEKGFFGKELWRNLAPKYLTEYKLESSELGLRGRADRIKFAGEITPVEIKTRDRIFESDKIQLAGYALLLEQEFSKQVNKGIIENLGKQQEIDITPELKNKVLEIADTIRVLTEENASMPSNFEKCRNCEFNANCN